MRFLSPSKIGDSVDDLPPHGSFQNPRAALEIESLDARKTGDEHVRLMK